MRSLGKPGATTPRSRSTSVLTHLLAGATAAALGVSMLGASPAAGVIADPLAPEGPSAIDVRRGDSVAPTAAQREAVRALGATARFNRFGTPQSLINRDGYLAEGIDAPDAAAAAEKFLLDNRELFRLGSLDGLEPTGTHRLAPGAFAVSYQQQVDGLPTTAGGDLVLGVTGSAEKGWKVAYAASQLTGDTSARRVAEPLSPVEAWVASANELGVDVDAQDVTERRRTTSLGWTRLDVEGLDRAQTVRAAAFPSPDGTVRAFETTVLPDDGEGYWQVVDAAGGDVLFRESVVDHATDDPHWRVFPATPPRTNRTSYPYGYPSTDTRALWCWTAAAPGCDMTLENSASPQPWDVEGATDEPSLTTSGNNARAQENWLDANFPGNGTQPPPVSQDREYDFPWTNAWFEERCNPANLVPGGNDVDAAAVNLFTAHNRMHDFSYHLGFTPARWNAQDDNNGYPGATAGNDRILGNVQSGAKAGGRDNANMFTRPDGTASWSNMYLWQPLAGAFYSPCVDGDFDMGIIGHEYGHMIENRMIGKGARRSGFNAGAMGESFGDLNGMEYLNEHGFVPVGGESPYAVGVYATGDGDQAIRNYNMSWPAAGRFPAPGKDPFVNPLNYSDVGYDLTGPQVHADGEIWSATQFSIRTAFVQRYGAGSRATQVACANGERDVTACPGNRRWFQLYYDAMLLMPTAPTFLDARDAMLAADRMRFGGDNQDLLWLGFARRGFGDRAATTGPDDEDPRADFTSPLHGRAAVDFDVVSAETGQTVPAKVYVGHYEARVTPIADTDPQTGDLDDVAHFAPDGAKPAPTNQPGYDIVVNAPGYGHQRLTLKNLKAGQTKRVKVRMSTNYASSSQGAVATGDGTNQVNLIDDTENTTWDSTDAPVEGRRVVVDLAGGRQKFKRVQVSAHLLGFNRFTALRSFDVLACTAGGADNPECDGSNPVGWRTVLRSQDDAFPAVNPRPRAPELILRSWSVKPTTATHVMLKVRANQCTGQPSYQGEQDADPGNVEDCRTGGPSAAGAVLPPRNTEVHAAELQVLAD